MSESVRIGKITGPHGVDGTLSFTHALRKNTRFDQWDCLLVELHPGSYIPFFIESIRSISDTECLCKFEELDSREAARALANKNIYPSVNFTVEDVIKPGIRRQIGFMVYDGDRMIGEVIDVIEGGQNEMWVVQYGDKEVLIPSQADWVEFIHPGNKMIKMNLPEGLLDL